MSTPKSPISSTPLHGVPTEQVEVLSDEAKKAFKFLNIEI